MGNASISNELVSASRMRSPLTEAFLLRPRKTSSKRKMVTALVLTSLVDAFSIMLLYLLCQNSGNGSTLELAQSSRLPSAVKAEALHDGTVIRIENGTYFVDEKKVDSQNLAHFLQTLKMKVQKQNPNSQDGTSLIIQADRDTEFSTLAHVIRSGSVSGFHKYRFAVLQDEGL